MLPKRKEKEGSLIKISDSPLKLLKDTSATKSFINPEIPEENFSRFVKKEPSMVSSIFQTTTRNFCAEISLFSEFNSNKFNKFHLFKLYNLLIRKVPSSLHPITNHPSLITIGEINYYFSFAPNHIL